MVEQLGLLLDLPGRLLPRSRGWAQLGFDVRLDSDFLHLRHIRQAWPVADPVQQVPDLLRLAKAPDWVQSERRHLGILVFGEQIKTRFDREITRTCKRNLGQFDQGAGLHAHEAHRLIVGKSECHQPLLTGQLARDDWLPTGRNIVADLQHGTQVTRRHVHVHHDNLQVILISTDFGRVYERFSALRPQGSWFGDND